MSCQELKKHKDLPNTPVWLALYTRSHAEKKVTLALKGQGVECYLPLQKELRQWSDRKKWVEEPLLRNYVFVKTLICKTFELQKIQGAVLFVSFNGKPAIIPEKQINDLKCFLNDSTRKVEVTNESFEKGDHVVICEGPLCGVEGEVVEIRGKKHLVLTFKSLGCNVFTEINKEDVWPMGKKEYEPELVYVPR